MSCPPEQSKEMGQSDHQTPKNGIRHFFKWAVIVLIVIFVLGFVAQNISTKLKNLNQEVEDTQTRMISLQNEVTVLSHQVKDQETVLRQQIQLSQTETPQHIYYRRVLNAKAQVLGAENYLRLTSDIPGALNLLLQAEKEIENINDEKIRAIQDALIKDIANLRNAHMTSPGDLYLKISVLRQEIQELPLRFVPVEPQLEKENLSKLMNLNGAWWQNGLIHSWNAIKSMVVVYHVPSKDGPLFVTPDLSPYVYQDLNTLLNEAIWAVFQKDEKVYRSSLEQASTWVRKYFLLNSAITQNFLSELTRLSSISMLTAKEENFTVTKMLQDYTPAAGTSGGL